MACQSRNATHRICNDIHRILSYGVADSVAVCIYLILGCTKKERFFFRESENDARNSTPQYGRYYAARYMYYASQQVKDIKTYNTSS